MAIEKANYRHMKLINKTLNGQLTFCPLQACFFLEFGNMFLTFTSDELQRFYEYVTAIDAEYYLDLNKESFNRRKLLIRVSPTNQIMFGLYPNEFLELKELLSGKKKFQSLQTAPLNVKLNKIIIKN